MVVVVVVGAGVVVVGASVVVGSGVVVVVGSGAVVVGSAVGTRVGDLINAAVCKMDGGGGRRSLRSLLSCILNILRQTAAPRLPIHPEFNKADSSAGTFVFVGILCPQNVCFNQISQF